MDWLPMWFLDFLILLHPYGEPLFIAFVGGSLAGWFVGYKTAKVLSEQYVQSLQPIVEVMGRGNSPIVEVVGRETPRSFIFNGAFRVGSESKPAKPLYHSFTVTCRTHMFDFPTNWFPFHPNELLNPGGSTRFESSIKRMVHDEAGCNLHFIAMVRYADFKELGFYEQTAENRIKVLRKDPRKTPLWKFLWTTIRGTWLKLTKR